MSFLILCAQKLVPCYFYYYSFGLTDVTLSVSKAEATSDDDVETVEKRRMKEQDLISLNRG
jgi:hypothetical protein